jgi:hypothetical protein
MRTELVDAALNLIDLEQKSHAVFSDNGIYRYWLHRSWFTGKGWTVFIMLNPSTADAYQNDPTVRRCVGFAQLWGSRGVVIVNVYGAKATDPENLFKMQDPIGPQNDIFIHAACRLAPRVICAWGAHELVRRRLYKVINIIHDMKATPVCLALTKAKCPQHPLYVRADAHLEPFHGR